MSKGITILGSTGSIGCNTLDVISRSMDAYRIVALSANTNCERIIEQCKTWKPVYVVMQDDASAQIVADALKSINSDTNVLSGMDGLNTIAGLSEIDVVVAGIVGAAGLLPTMAAAKAGKRILLANKEALVMSGKLLMDTVKNNGAELLPVDSEHNAIFQCMPAGYAVGSKPVEINKILLTASGGPFRMRAIDTLKNVTPEEAINHPNWEMGKKISVDSATMMNKGLEVIEAKWLFELSSNDIEVVIHPQSVIHSMVTYVDGSVLAQLGNPDMRTPIAHALAWPARINSGVEPLDIFEVAKLEFEKPDMKRFGCLKLCYEAMDKGGTASIILNAANEIAVASFLDNKIAFTAIADVIEETLSLSTIDDVLVDVNAIMQSDLHARNLANECVARAA